MGISLNAEALRGARRGRARKAPVAIPRKKPASHERNPATVRTRKEALQAFELRAAGANDIQIAEKLGISVDRARNRLKIGMELVQQHTLTRAADVAKMECARIDRMRMALWQRCMKGEDKAIRTYLLLMDQRSKYTAGVYAEQRASIDVLSNGQPSGRVVIESAGLLKRLEDLAGAEDTKRKLLSKLVAPPDEIDVDVPEEVIDAWDVGATLVDISKDAEVQTRALGSVMTVERH